MLTRSIVRDQIDSTKLLHKLRSNTKHHTAEESSELNKLYIQRTRVVFHSPFPAIGKARSHTRHLLAVLGDQSIGFFLRQRTLDLGILHMDSGIALSNIGV
jgi:hypothetical protein